MQSYIADFIPRFINYSKNLNNISAIVEKEWVLFNTTTSEKTIFIFRRNNELLITNNTNSLNGNVNICRWELINNDSLLLKIENKNYLLRSGFIDSSFLVLKLFHSNEYYFFINNLSFSNSSRSIEGIKRSLEEKYCPEPEPEPEKEFISEKFAKIGSVIIIVFFILLAIVQSLINFYK